MHSIGSIKESLNYHLNIRQQSRPSYDILEEQSTLNQPVEPISKCDYHLSSYVRKWHKTVWNTKWNDSL